MTERESTSALVLGGGVSGLLAANILAKHFDTVTVLDRRPLLDDGLFEESVPQADHLHVLLKRGQQIVEEFFPGLLAECAASDDAPALINNWGKNTHWVNPFGAYPVHEAPIETWMFSRKRLDAQLMKRVRSNHNITFRTATVNKLLGNTDGTRVLGVQASGEGGDFELHADLIVECRGRASKVIDSLTALGYPEPSVSVVDNELGYSSQFFLVKDTQPAWRLAYRQVRPGLLERGGAICHVEGNMAVVTLIGSGKHRPGSGQEEFFEFARNLDYGYIHAVLKDATPIGKPKVWANLGNRWHHFGRMPRWPQGLVVIGDAMCRFNPLYGQGMTVAALEVEALGKTLASMQELRDTPWEARFQRHAESFLATPWLMAATEDQRNVAISNPGLSTRLLHRYLDLVFKGAVVDKALHVAFLRILHMMASPLSLVAPMLVMRVIYQAVGRLFGKKPIGYHAVPGVPTPGNLETAPD